jgi:AcrR family transcriptional regulator
MADPEPRAARARTPKGEQTRALILDTALELFRERGYEETTMRAIAERAGVALGGAYYYFRSKEELIQGFYGRTHREHLEAAAPVLERETTLRARLLGVMHAKLDTIEPYHPFAGVLFKTAADPRSPLNPFSAESRPVRAEATALFAEVVRGARDRIPADLAAELPGLLWTYHMGVVLFWIHDASPGRRRSRRLVEHSVDLVCRLVGLSSLPLMRPLRSAALRMIAGIQEDGEEEEGVREYESTKVRK